MRVAHSSTRPLIAVHAPPAVATDDIGQQFKLVPGVSVRIAWVLHERHERAHLRESAEYGWLFLFFFHFFLYFWKNVDYIALAVTPSLSHLMRDLDKSPLFVTLTS